MAVAKATTDVSLQLCLQLYTLDGYRSGFTEARIWLVLFRCFPPVSARPVRVAVQRARVGAATQLLRRLPRLLPYLELQQLLLKLYFMNPCLETVRAALFSWISAFRRAQFLFCSNI